MFLKLCQEVPARLTVNLRQVLVFSANNAKSWSMLLRRHPLSYPLRFETDEQQTLSNGESFMPSGCQFSANGKKMR